MIERLEKIQAEGKAIFERKNKDYGNSFAEDGVLGVMIRMKDKMNRFITLARNNGEGAVKDEALRDTLIDLHNYAAMAIIAHEDGEGWESKNPALLHTAGTEEETVPPAQPRTPLNGKPDKNHHEERA